MDLEMQEAGAALIKTKVIKSINWFHYGGNMGDNTSILNFQQSELLMIRLHGLNLRIGFKFWNLKQENTTEVSKMGSHPPCWKKIAGIGFLIIILKNLISGFGDVLVSFSQW